MTGAIQRGPGDGRALAPDDRVPVPSGRPAAAVTLLRATRPRQWLKNVLVFAAPTAAGVVVHPAAFGRTVAAFWIFVAASAATYLVNDVRDRENDQMHPVKRERPVASGALSPGAALTAAGVLGAGAVAAAWLLSTPLLGVVLVYLVISVGYSLGAKHVALIELVCVASGFTLRAVAGGAATHVPISPWFLVMTSFGALLVVTGKRTSEQEVMGDLQGRHRAALAEYPSEFLRGVRRLAMSVTVTTYCLWAFQRAANLRPADHAEDLIWFELSIVPFVLAVLAVELAISKGRGGEPEQMAISDRLLQLFGVAWLVMLICGIYA